MGTSTSHPSPRTTSWRAVSAAYRSQTQNAERIARLIWRASHLAGGLGLEKQLAKPIIARCLELSLTSESPEVGARAVSKEIAVTGQTGIGAELARRALGQSYHFDDRKKGFAKSLIAEATNFLISRDLPMMLGKSDRLRSVSDITFLKAEILTHVRSIVEQVSPIPIAPNNWQEFIAKVCRRLRDED